VGAPAKTWHLLPHEPAAIAALARQLRVSPIVAQVLLNRGLGEPTAARQFLASPLGDLHKPELLPGAVAAAQRLLDAVRRGQRICVYGDYDVDGITGTAILWQAIRLVGGTADYYIPHRLDEGYGLNRRALRQIAQSGAALVITVDCGISALDEAAEAQQLGLELIVTDHHEFKPQLPQAAVLVHPRLPGGDYPYGGLSGAGVAFKVAWALCQLASGSEKVPPAMREFLLDGVALATLGLVADVVPLQAENRVFVRHGLARLEKMTAPGLRALLEVAGIGSKSPLLAEDIGFKLAPRLNAAGRLGSARLVVELLTTASAPRAADLARHLDTNNQQRQQLERRILVQAREQVAADGLSEAPALVLASADWHPGVIGIVAGRLAEQFARPALMIALTEARVLANDPRQEAQAAAAPPGLVGHGSGRSVAGFPLHEALQECSDLLLGHGGHAAAAGFRIQAAHLPVFRERFCATVSQRFVGGLPPPRLAIDAEVPLQALTHDLLRDLDRLEPYGCENRRPLFLAGDLRVVGTPTKVGQGERHLSFKVRQAGTMLRAIAFNMGDRLDELMAADGACCVVLCPRINDWQGMRRIEIEVLDFQAGAQARLLEDSAGPPTRSSLI